VVAISGAVIITASTALAGFFLQQRLNPPQPDQQRVVAATIPAKVVGTRAPEFTLPDLDNQLRQLTEWQGKLIVINFWATWCPPCREEIPVFMALQDEHAGQGLQFIGIALQEADEVREYVAAMGINYPVLSGYREVIKLSEALGNYMGALPYTVIINRDGMVVFARAGPLDEATARSVIEAYL